MPKYHIDFLEKLAPPDKAVFAQAPQASSWRSITKHIMASTLGIILIVVLAYVARAVVSGQNLAEQFGQTSIISQLSHLIGAKERLLRGEDKDRINILLLGIGGDNHEGGQLTDTIMVASIRPSDKTVALLSIPRDLVAPIPGVGWQKINTANSFGRARNPGTVGAGEELARATVADITGLAIDYYVKLDFSGFKKVIDALGGIRINVPKEFTDSQYPDYNFGYSPVRFDAGEQVFDGERALQYSRSRHGTNGEGSDFARARRQQEILTAIQGRVLDLSTILNPNKLLTLADIVGSHMTTNMEIWESLRLSSLARDLKSSAITQVVLSNEADGLLSSDISADGAYLLRPKAGAENFSEIKAVAQNIFAPHPLEKIAQARSAEVKATRVAIQNGTFYPGLAQQTAQLLQKLSYQVTQVGNAVRRDYQKTVIYNLSGAPPGAAIQMLRDELQANIAPDLPQFVQTPAADVLVADVLVIVGEDATKDSLSLVSNQEDTRHKAQDTNKIQ